MRRVRRLRFGERSRPSPPYRADDLTARGVQAYWLIGREIGLPDAAGVPAPFPPYLGWTQDLILMRVAKPAARAFHEIEAASISRPASSRTRTSGRCRCT